MRVTRVEIENMRCIKHAVIPMYRQINQVYADTEGEKWDIMVSHDIVLRAIKKDWTHLSNVCTDRMNIDSRITAIFQDDNDYVRTSNGDLAPACYKAVLKKARPESWNTDIVIDYFYSNDGDCGPWHPLGDNKLILRKIRQCCQEIIMDSLIDDDRYGVMKIDTFTYDMVKYADKDVRSDFTILLPWMMFDDETYGRTVIINDPYCMTTSDKIHTIFNTYLKTHCEGNFFTVVLCKKEELNMMVHTTVIHNGISYEYEIRHCDTVEERMEYYKQELERILSIKEGE